MGADQGLDDVKAEAPALLAAVAGLVDLVEPVEDQGQLLRRDGVALVGDGHIELAAADAQLQPQLAAGGAEFHRVVQQVVDHLGHGILVGPGEDGVLGQVHLDIQIFRHDLLLEGDKHLTDALLHVEAGLLLLGDAALVLEPGDVQHAADQTAQPLGLIGDDLHVVAVPLRGDGPIEHAVHIAADGGHGGLELVGDVGDKFLPLIFAFFQRFGHVVEGRCQLVHLLGVVAAGADTGLEVAVAEVPGRLGHLPQGTALVPGGHGHDHHGDEDDQQRYRHLDIRDALHEGLGVAGGHGHQHQADVRAGAVTADGNGDEIAVFRIELRDGAGFKAAALPEDLIHEILVDGQTQMGALQVHLGAEDHIAQGVQHHRIRPGDQGGQGQIGPQVLMLQITGSIVGRHQLRQCQGIGPELVVGIVLQVPAYQHPERAAQQQQCQQQDQHRGADLPGKSGFHGLYHLRAITCIA